MKARRTGPPGQSLPRMPVRPTETKSTLCSRLEKAIADLKPSSVNIDPSTNFWTVYKKVADDHDHHLVSKYAGDLDNSLLFVSALLSLTFVRFDPDPLLC